MKLIKRKTYIIFLSAVIIVSSIFVSFKLLDDDEDFEIAKSLDIFHNAVREVRMFYVDDADYSKLIGEITEEFLQKLDPYTVYYPESKMEEFTFMTTGAYGGIGALVLEKDHRLVITEIYKDSPADNAGLKVADEILMINGIGVNDPGTEDLKELIKGEPGSEIKIKFFRKATNETFEKSIIREKIEFDNIPYAELIDDKYAYIQLNQFKQNAGNELRNKLDHICKSGKPEGIILDLRGNPGGLLIEAVNIVSLFVDKGNEVVSTKGKVKKWNHVYKANGNSIYKDVPLIILINRGSASASEIVAGAIQDLDRGVIIGQRSYGKGLVQITRKMNYNTGIKITTAKYYIPSGRCIQAIDYSHRNPDGSVGIIPDSLISEFKTSKGRPVFDGGGIIPDIKINEDSLNVFTKELIKNRLIFDYVSKFYYEHNTIEKPEDFILNDEIYAEFSNFVSGSDIECDSKSSKIVDDLIKTIKEEKYNGETEEKVNELKSLLKLDKSKALKIYKDEIIPILDVSISGRYYYENGKAKTYLKYDKELKTALDLLENMKRYDAILSNIND